MMSRRESENNKNKLPAHLVNRWIRVVNRSIIDDTSDNEADKKMSKMASETNYPMFADFCKFLNKEARIRLRIIAIQWPFNVLKELGPKEGN